jgi:hypothetical protein
MKKKKPIDATMRNVKAGKKRDVALGERVKKLEANVKLLIERYMQCDK